MDQDDRLTFPVVGVIDMEPPLRENRHDSSQCVSRHHALRPTANCGCPGLRHRDKAPYSMTRSASWPTARRDLERDRYADAALDDTGLHQSVERGPDASLHGLGLSADAD